MIEKEGVKTTVTGKIRIGKGTVKVIDIKLTNGHGKIAHRGLEGCQRGRRL